MKRLLLASCGFIFLSGAIFLGAQTAVASCDTGTVLELCVTATPDPVKPGEHIFYSYTVANRGVVDLAGVVLTTLVPDHTRRPTLRSPMVGIVLLYVLPGIRLRGRWGRCLRARAARCRCRRW